MNSDIFQTLKNAQLCFSVEREDKIQNIYYLDEAVQGIQPASRSVLLSLSAYLLNKYPHIAHPKFIDYSNQYKIQENQAQNLSFHPLFQSWTQTFVENILQGNAIRYKNTLYLKVQVCFEYSEKYLKNKFVQKTFPSKQANIKSIFNLPEIEEKDNAKKIGYINVSKFTQLQDQHRPRINVPAILLGTIYNNEKWDNKLILNGDIPTVEQIAQYDSIIIPGSTLSVTDNNENIEKFVINLQKALQINPNLKILGICFGFQLMAKMLKSKIQTRPRRQGSENIQFDKDQVAKYPFLHKIVQNNPLYLNKYHGDFVTTIPASLTNIAKSQNCQVQFLINEKGTYFLIQSHFEFTSYFTSAYINRIKNYSHKPLQTYNSILQHYGKDELIRNGKHAEIMRTCVMQFLS